MQSYLVTGRTIPFSSLIIQSLCAATTFFKRQLWWPLQNRSGLLLKPSLVNLFEVFSATSLSFVFLQVSSPVILWASSVITASQSRSLAVLRRQIKPLICHLLCKCVLWWGILFKGLNKSETAVLVFLEKCVDYEKYLSIFKSFFFYLFIANSWKFPRFY